MFDNIGGKIKSLAKVVCWICIILFIIMGIIMCLAGPSYIIYGVLVAVLGSLASWIGSFVLYGFGELIDNSAKIEENTRKLLSEGNVNE